MCELARRRLNVTTMTHAHSSPHSADRSIQRRRDILRRFGQASLASGASSPLAALAGGTNGNKHCLHKTKQQQVHASISGMNSVVLSAQTGQESHGYHCGHYGNPSNVPPSCKTSTRCKKFKEIFPCGANDVDSHGHKQKLWNGSTDPDCYFNMTIDQLCSLSADCDEKHWVTAYCNASADHPQRTILNYPYVCVTDGVTDGVHGFYTDATKKQAAMEFFRLCMENRLS